MPTRTVLVLAALAALVAGMLLAALSSDGGAPAAAGSGRPHSVLSPQERAVLDAAPVELGTIPAGPDPGVDLTDPVAVAAAYVVAGYSLRSTDAGRTNRRATRYAEPASPPGTVGLLVVLPPPPGHRTVAVVTRVSQVGAEPRDRRRGYLVGYRTSDGPSERSRYLVLVRQLDDRWLVTADTTQPQIGEP